MDLHICAVLWKVLRHWTLHCRAACSLVAASMQNTTERSTQETLVCLKTEKELSVHAVCWFSVGVRPKLVHKGKTRVFQRLLELFWRWPKKKQNAFHFFCAFGNYSIRKCFGWGSNKQRLGMTRSWRKDVLHARNLRWQAGLWRAFWTCTLGEEKDFSFSAVGADQDPGPQMGITAGVLTKSVLFILVLCSSARTAKQHLYINLQNRNVMCGNPVFVPGVPHVIVSASHKTRRRPQMLRAKNGTHCCQLGCSHSIASSIKGFASKSRCKSAFASCVEIQSEIQEIQDWAFMSFSGADMEWVVRPPDEIKAGVPFWCEYRLILTDEFYEWAFSEIRAFDIAGPNGNGFRFVGKASTMLNAGVHFRPRGRNVLFLPYLEAYLWKCKTSKQAGSRKSDSWMSALTAFPDYRLEWQNCPCTPCNLQTNSLILNGVWLLQCATQKVSLFPFAFDHLSPHPVKGTSAAHFWLILFALCSGIRQLNFSTMEEAKAWCHNVTCPQEVKEVDVTSCCIHHVNVHSCPITEEVSYCGPWIPAEGKIFTHSCECSGKLSNKRNRKTKFICQLIPSNM